MAHRHVQQQRVVVVSEHCIDSKFGGTMEYIMYYSDLSLWYSFNLFCKKKVIYVPLTNIVKIYYCDTCTEKFDRKSHLTTHTNGVHNNVKHKCDECGREYTSIAALYRHVI